MNRAALGLVMAVTATCCAGQVSQRSAGRPISMIQTDGSGEAFVELEDGVAARDIIGPELFTPLHPGITPEEAARTIGPRVKTEKAENLSLFYYNTPGGPVAIAERRIAGPGSPQRTSAYEVRAFPGTEYAERLPVALRDLLAKERPLFRVVLVSDVPDDWHVRLMVRDNRVECVVAFPRSMPSGSGAGGM